MNSKAIASRSGGSAIRPFPQPVRRRLMPLSEVASLLNRSPRSVRRWIASGLLPGHRIGGQLMVKPEDLAAFIERGRVTPAYAEALEALNGG